MTEQEFTEDLAEVIRLTRLYGIDARDNELLKLAFRMFSAAAGGRDIRDWAARWLEASKVTID